MLTMRSDFLGDCDVFDGLPQAINQSQYLTPRLNLRQLSEAIVRPLKLAQFQGSVAPELVQRILNDIGTGRDELPIVQHALFRTWQKAKELRPSETVELTLSDYDAVGGLKSALSQHADEALIECKRHGQERVVEKVFRGLCTRGTDGQQIRRPATIQQLADESGVSTDDVKSVVNTFRRNDRCFLMPPAERELTPTTKIDISHEALIRQWQVLSGEWFCREDDSKRRLLRVVDDEQKHALHRGDLLAGVELDEVEQWWHQEQPTAAWVRRYVDTQPLPSPRGSRAVDVSVDAHAEVREFITLSRTEQTRREKQADEEVRQAQETETKRRLAEAEAVAKERRGRLQRTLLSVVAVIAVAAGGLGILAVIAMSQAESQRMVAVLQKEKAQKFEAMYRESSRAFSQIANDAREKGNSIKATHAFLHVVNSLHEANAPIEEQRNALLAAQFSAGNIVQTIPGFGTRVVSNHDSSLMLAWDDGPSLQVWDMKKAEIRGRCLHNGNVSGAVFTKGDSQVLSWSTSGTVSLWHINLIGGSGIASGPIMRWNHQGMVYGALLSQDESHVLTWGADGTARLWYASVRSIPFSELPKIRDDDQPLQTFKHEAAINGVQFSPDGSRILTWSDDKTARVWDSTKAQPIQTFNHEGRVFGAHFSHDDSRVLTWSDGQTARIWDVTKSDSIQTFKHDGRVNGAQFSSDKLRVLTWSDDGTAQVWDTANAEPIHSFRHGRAVIGAQFSRDETRLLIWGGDRACLWDVIRNTLIGTWAHDSSVFSSQFNFDESLVLTWSADNKARIWNVSEARPTQVFGHDSAIRGARFTNDGSEVLTWSADQSLKRWHAEHPRLLQTLQHESPVGGATLNEEADLLLTWCFDPLGVSKIQSWELSGDHFSAKAEISKGAQWPLGAQGTLLSRDGQRCLGWSYNTLASMQGEAVLWNLEDAKVIRRFEHLQNGLTGPSNAILGASWNSDEKQVLTWGFDNTANLWDVSVEEPLQQISHADSGVGRSGKPIAKLNGGVLSADGKTILTWSDDRTARLWDAASGQERQRCSHKTRVTGACFSPDESSYVLTWTGGDSDAKSGAQNAIGKNDVSAEVSVWKIGDSGSPIGVFRHEAAVNGAWMSRDQSQVLTCSDDATAAIWDLKTHEKLQSFRHADAVLGAKFLHGDSLVLTWSRDKTAALWDASRKLPLAVFNHDGPVTGALTNRDDTRMLTWSSGSAKWWDISLHDEHLTPDERILEFEVRSATQLNAAGEIVPLGSKEWREKRDVLIKDAGTRYRPNAGR